MENVIVDHRFVDVSYVGEVCDEIRVGVKQVGLAASLPGIVRLVLHNCHVLVEKLG